MIYNKPRDIKLRALPSLSSLVGGKSKKTTVNRENTDNSTNIRQAVSQTTDTASTNIPSGKKIAFKSKSKPTADNTKDFDIILNPENSAEVYDLTEMPVIEGIPMLVLPEEKSIKRPELFKETTATSVAEMSRDAKKETKAESASKNQIVDLADMPDIDGIPLLPTKATDGYEKIQLIQEFHYAPTKVTTSKVESIPRPVFDDDEFEQRLEKERIAREKAEAERLEKERIAREKAEAERLEKERIAREKAVAERLEKERIAREKAEAERLEKERIAREKAESERLEKERIAREKAEVERLEKERIAREKADAERLEKERISREKAEKKAASEKEKKEQALLKAQQKKVEKEKAEKKRAVQKEEKRVRKSAEKKIRAEKIARKKDIYKKRFSARFDSYKKIPRTRKVKIASFFVVLYLSTIIAFIIPLRPTYSETEKRNLTKFPEFSSKALLSGDYFADISTWFSDTFPFREQLTRVNTQLKSLYGFDTVTVHGDVEAGDEIPDAPLDVEEEATEEATEPVTMPDEDDLHSDNGDPNAKKPDIEVQSMSAIIVAGDSGYEYYSFAQDIAPRLISCVNDLDGIVKPKGKVYAMIAPTSMDITLNDAIRAEVSSANQEKALKYFNASFKNAVAVDGIYQAERDHRDEYIYFRTDHHWTARGAYYAYEQFTFEKGIDAVPLKDYKTKKFENFIGTFYASSGQNSALRENPDHVTAYLPKNDVTCQISESAGGHSFEWKIINDVTNYDAGGKYLTFIGGDNALTTITNNDLKKGETCIVIKESYGNAFVPFLIPHYKKIYVIDPRHYSGTLTDFCKDKKIDDVIFLCNISATRNYIYLEALENLVQ